MKLLELSIPGMSLPQNASEIDIKSISFDSRNIKEGSIFVALKGENYDGHNYINDAILAGANSLLVDQDCNSKFQIPTSKSINVRRDLALISAKFFKDQPNIISSVTGTNGKTSVCHFVQKIWELNGFKSSAIGTLGLISSARTEFDNYNVPNLTTLDPVSLHKCLANLKKSGTNRVSIEASSHGLAQHRIDGINTSIACFTNLSHDHLDYHITFKNYKNEKFRLFNELLQEGGTAIINSDDKYSEELINLISKRNLKVVTYGKNNDSIWKIEGIYEQRGNKVFKLKVNNIHYTIPTALNSNFQIYNAVAAAAIANSSGIPLDHSILSIRNLQTPNGRMQIVPNNLGYKIFIDYAHTPGALETVLQEFKNKNSQLILVIGCGGERDTQKRSKIGNIASKLCDKIFVTDDNPRKESPSKIRKQIIEGSEKNELNKFLEIANRKEAIFEAIISAQKNDVILIAGKGHEKEQQIGNEVILFDDFIETKKIISKLEAK